MIKSRNTVPAIKDKKINLVTVPAPTVPAYLFRDPHYDYEVVSINVGVVGAATTAGAAQFELGYGEYSDAHGVIQLLDYNAFLDESNCLDNTGQPFSTEAIPAGTSVEIPLSHRRVLPAGAPLVIGGAFPGGGPCIITITLRPKDKDRGDFSKRPGGAADFPYTTYYK